MRSPVEVLNSLQTKTAVKGYLFERLYRNLYNPNFYLIAYQNIYNNSGSMTRGIDGQTLDGMGMERIYHIIKMLKDHSYRPNPVHRQYIPKANGKVRPLGIPSADDKLIQEVVKMILEGIYEPTFSKCSHGFRPGRSCHTALDQIQRTYTGIKWFVEGDIKGCFDNIDQHVLIQILRRKIRDEHFIALIWKFLRAGYMENWRYHETYSGAAQGSIISPILANIYMNELDVYMQEYKQHFDTGQKRADNLEYSRRKARWYEFKKSVEKKWNTLSEEDRSYAQAKLEAKRQAWAALPSMNPMDESYRRITYCRYADDFLIGVIGSKMDAERIKENIKTFLSEHLKLELSLEKTLITHTTGKARFLGYDVTTTKPSSEFIRRNGARYRRTAGIIKLYVPKEKWVKNLLEKNILWIQKDETGKERWMPVARSSFVNRAPVEIVGTFNAEIRGLYNYYALACNVSVLSKYRYVMEYSMYKTFACKYRCPMVKAKLRYWRDGIFSVPYVTSTGTEKQIPFYHDGFKKKKLSRDNQIDISPKPVSVYNFHPKELIVRILKGKCELCGKRDDTLKVYQVKKLSELRENLEWEALMTRMRRKTLAVCHDCYDRIQS
ncbi:reverse transcriptase domain-containing protein [Ethanoligenens sp.]|uniref:reverse transcriptase/maturase family protein n=1 Tax=Ethanoligenens sp. TaxID=2099655 RepID=UPI0039E9C79D